MDVFAPFGAAIVTILAVWGITHKQFEVLTARIAALDDKIDGKADRQDVRDLSVRIDNLMMELLRSQRPPA
jgi:hypothetical protein